MTDVTQSTINSLVIQMAGDRITRRDFFAAAALQGLLADGGEIDVPSFTDLAVEYADSLIDSLKRRSPPAT